MSYRTRLATLEEHLSLIQPARARLILLTGQSSFQSSRLSPDQSDFLAAIAPPHVEAVRCGFPYHATFDRDAPQPSLAAASFRNALQVFWSLFSPAYRHSVARSLQTVISNTSGSLYIVTGSCGLQLLASAWPLLTLPPNLRVHVIALGPALLHAGAFPLQGISVLQGRRDLWSRLLYRGPSGDFCDSGHMDYWTSPHVRDFVAQFLRTP